MSDESTSKQGAPISLLAHPWVLLAVVITAANDHLLKGSGLLPGVITGKLSDVTGLFFFPILLAVLFYLFFWAFTHLFARKTPDSFADTRHLIDVAAILTVVVFSALNLSETANRLAEPYWGVVTMDATDLLCLPMALAARQFARNRWPRPRLTPSPKASSFKLRWHHGLALAAACFVSMATSSMTYSVPGYPSWEIESPYIACHHDVEIDAWFAKSGKEGAGLTLRFDNRSNEPREITVEHARLQVRSIDASPDDVELEIQAGDGTSVTVDETDAVYLPFLFDNNRAWNRNLRAAEVRIDLTIDGYAVELQYHTHQDETPWRQTYNNYDSYNRPWGPDDEMPNMERTGGEETWLRRDSDDLDDLRVRLSRDLPGGCPGDDDE